MGIVTSLIVEAELAVIVNQYKHFQKQCQYKQHIRNDSKQAQVAHHVQAGEGLQKWSR